MSAEEDFNRVVREGGAWGYIYFPPGDEWPPAGATVITTGGDFAVRATRAARERPSNPASVR